MLNNILWHLGKLLQLIALITAPYALYIGMYNHDAKGELKILLLALVQFILGLTLVRLNSRS